MAVPEPLFLAALLQQHHEATFVIKDTISGKILGQYTNKESKTVAVLPMAIFPKTIGFPPATKHTPKAGTKAGLPAN